MSFPFPALWNALSVHCVSKLCLNYLYSRAHIILVVTSITGDLAVDWINDKLYWTERDKGRIIELDLETNDRRTAVTTDSTAVLNGLVMYPYPGQGYVL